MHQVMLLQTALLLYLADIFQQCCGCGVAAREANGLLAEAAAVGAVCAGEDPPDRHGCQDG